MRHAVLTLEVDDEAQCFVVLRHVPGCSCAQGEVHRLGRTYMVPPQAAVAIMEGTGRVLQLTGQAAVEVVDNDERAQVPRPAELDDPDRRPGGGVSGHD